MTFEMMFRRLFGLKKDYLVIDKFSGNSYVYEVVESKLYFNDKVIRSFPFHFVCTMCEFIGPL